MVYTKSQRRKIAEMAEEPWIMTDESSHNVGEYFLNRVLQHMKELVFDITSMKAEHEGCSKVMEELEDLKV